MINWILRLVVDSRLLISAAAACLYYCTVKITGIETDLLYLTLIFFATASVYNIPSFINKKYNVKLYLLLPWLCLLAGGGLLVLYRCFSFKTVFVSLLLLLLIVFYYFPLPRLNLRGVPFLKIFIISLSWTIATASLPVLLQIKELSLTHHLLFIERFVFIFAITIPFDIRDLDKDKKTDLKTIPQFTGIGGAIFLSYLLLLGYLLLTYWHFGAGPLLFSRILCVTFVAILLARISPDKPDYYYTGLLDGSMILQSVLLALLI